MNLVKTAKLWGNSWRIKFCNLDVDTFGDCDWKARTIRIREDLKGKILLDTLIHESLHATCPYLEESVVEGAGTDLARLLWRLGWRLEGKD